MRLSKVWTIPWSTYVVNLAAEIPYHYLNLQVYHPDKNQSFGLAWVKTCEAVTKLFNSRFL